MRHTQATVTFSLAITNHPSTSEPLIDFHYTVFLNMIYDVLHRLSGFALNFKCCHTLVSILQLKQSSLRVLDLTDCVYSYPRDYSGYFSQETKKMEKYEDVNDELSLLSIIPAALIGPVCKLVELR